VALTRGPAENRAGRKYDFHAPALFYGNERNKFPKYIKVVIDRDDGEINEGRSHGVRFFSEDGWKLLARAQERQSLYRAECELYPLFRVELREGVKPQDASGFRSLAFILSRGLVHPLRLKRPQEQNAVPPGRARHAEASSKAGKVHEMLS
jgi:hypothetical protein